MIRFLILFVALLVAAPASAESRDAGKSPAAWQEIFDLGDDAP